MQEQLAAEKAHPSRASATRPRVQLSAQLSVERICELRSKIFASGRRVQESQIATHEQTKVETESKYPLKVSGLLLFNGYVNTRQVDVSAAPTYAMPGGGSTGFSLRQTVLGLDARGPHLFGATSHADVRVDFFAGGVQSSYAAGGVLRLRTAHAGLKWQNTEAFIQQDRSFLAPNVTLPPSLRWRSRNLPGAAIYGRGIPQIGLSHQIGLAGSKRLNLEAGLIDLADPQLPGVPDQYLDHVARRAEPLARQ